MLRVGKLTDYGTALMTRMAERRERPLSAAELAADLGLGLPTVSKILKSLMQSGLLTSHRGVKGGYGLAHAPQEISVAQIIAAIEGPIALTDCSDAERECGQAPLCPVRGNWRRINEAVLSALQGVTLAELARPVTAHPLRFVPREAKPDAGRC